LVSKISSTVGVLKPWRTAWHHAVPVSSKRSDTVIVVSPLEMPVTVIEGGVRSSVVMMPMASRTASAWAKVISLPSPTVMDGVAVLAVS